MKRTLLLLAFFLVAVLPSTAVAIPLAMDPKSLRVEINCGYDTNKCAGGFQYFMDVSLLAGNSDTNTISLQFSNLTGPADDIFGIGFYSIAPGVGHQILMTSADVTGSSFDTFTVLTSLPRNNFLLQISDADGMGSAVLTIHLEETPKSIFIRNTGSWAITPTHEAFIKENLKIFLFGILVPGQSLPPTKYLSKKIESPTLHDAPAW